MRCYRLICALLVACCLTAPVRASGVSTLTAAETAAWRADLHAAWDAIVRYHRAPFHATARARFEREIARLDRDMPKLTRPGAILGLARIAALLGDAHSGLDAGSHPPASFHTFGIKLYPYADGVFVQAAEASSRDLLGAKLIAIDGTNVDEAVRRVTPYAGASNAMTVRWQLPFLLARPELLYAAGIAREPLAATLTFAAPDGARIDRRFTPTASPATAFAGMNPYRLGAGGDWVDARAASAPVPFVMRHPDRPYWFELDEPNKTLYIADTLVLDHGEESLEAFFVRALAAAHEHAVERVVLDLRLNGGGNNQLLEPIVSVLAADPLLKQRNRFFVIVGRQTQSAAENFVDRLERRTRARFVGEPTGEAPNMYGDAVAFVLPQSGLTLHLSSLYWQDSLPYDPRAWTPPEVAAELTAADYAAGRDPAYDAIVAGLPPPLGATVRPAMGRDDAAAVTQDAAAWFALPAHRYADGWQSLPSLAYEAAAQGHQNAALALMRFAAERYPGRAFAHDDLADMLASAKQRDAARAEYREALRRDPRDARAAAGLSAISRAARI